MLRASELAEYVGQVGQLCYADLWINVEVMDVTIGGGTARYQVKPVAGEGTMWVEHLTFKGGK